MTTPADGTEGAVAVALAVLTSRMEDVRTGLADVRRDLAAQQATYVQRNEWALRNTAVDRRFTDQGREIGELRTEIRSRRTPWTSVVPAIVSVVSVVVALAAVLTR